jgi:crossover junction endodeoxyribonuclease RusA
MREYRVLLPSGLPLLSSNLRLHYMERYRRSKALKDSAYLVARSLQIPQLLKADITAILHPGPRTRLFDPHNFADSVKPAIDGLVLAGVLPRDDSRYLRKVTIEAGEKLPGGWQLELVIRPLRPGDPDVGSPIRSDPPLRPRPRAAREPVPPSEKRVLLSV